MNYQTKYLKYKNKYLNLKNQMNGGSSTSQINNEEIEPLTQQLLTTFKPYELIKINNKLFSLPDIYEWVIVLRKEINPLTNKPLKDNDIKRIKRFHEYIEIIKTDPVKNIRNILNSILVHRTTSSARKIFALAAVAHNGLALRSIIPQNLVRKESPYLVREEQRYDNEITLENEGLYKDDEIIMEALNNNGLALQYAPYKQNKEDYVMKAVTNNGLALQYADSDLQNNKQIVRAAIINNGLALQYASPSLKKDHNILSMAVNNNGLALQYVDKKIRYYNAIAIDAVKNNGLALQYASPSVQENYDIVSMAVNNNGLALQYADTKLKKNEAIVIDAIKNNKNALNYASSDLQEKLRVNLLENEDDSNYLATIYNNFSINNINNINNKNDINEYVEDNTNDNV